MRCGVRLVLQQFKKYIKNQRDIIIKPITNFNMQIKTHVHLESALCKLLNTVFSYIVLCS